MNVAEILILLTCLFAVPYSRREQKPLLEALQHYMDGTKSEKDEQEIINHVNGRLRKEEKYHTWALRVTRLLHVGRFDFLGMAIILFESKIAVCPSETQRRLSLEFSFRMKYQGNPCTPERLNATFPCSLQYSKSDGKSVVSCHPVS
uniref:Cystatin domain-containing protein n=1 Tax=Trichuris muris TaxID=70415 RepID=A0A5S6QGE8_TRIMR